MPFVHNVLLLCSFHSLHSALPFNFFWAAERYSYIHLAPAGRQCRDGRKKIEGKLTNVCSVSAILGFEFYHFRYIAHFSPVCQSKSTAHFILSTLSVIFCGLCGGMQPLH